MPEIYLSLRINIFSKTRILFIDRSMIFFSVMSYGFIHYHYWNQGFLPPHCPQHFFLTIFHLFYRRTGNIRFWASWLNMAFLKFQGIKTPTSRFKFFNWNGPRHWRLTNVVYITKKLKWITKFIFSFRKKAVFNYAIITTTTMTLQGL